MKRLMSKIKSVAVAALAMGLALGAKADTVACTNCLTFSAEDDFGIRMVKGSASSTPTVSLEYSTDQVNWTTFNADTDYKAGTDHKLYLRGKDNTNFGGEIVQNYCNIFTNTSDSVATAIACSGNIETLLDYQTVAAGNHPTMEDYAFTYLFRGFAALTTPPTLPATTLANSCYTYMFSGCSSLTAAPELRATTLADSCYCGMFKGCKSLTEAPELRATTLAHQCYGYMFNGCTSLTNAPTLPATTLAESCYQDMFNGCTSLTAAPELRATTLTYYCYSGMFKGCTSLTDIPALNVAVVTNSCCKQMFMGCSNLVVNTERPGVEWCIPSGVVIPSTADSTAKYYWATNMFKNTSGTITNSSVVTPGTTYYIASAPVEFRVTQPEYATFQAYANGAPVSVPFTGNYLTDFTVTYTADKGYVFPDGKTEFTTNITERAETVTVTLPKDQQPKPLPPVNFEVSNPEGATATVYSNAVDAANLVPAGGTVLSNSIAYVVYTVSEAGKYFENGQAAVTNKLDTTTNPATDKSAYVPTSAGTPKVQLGVVAQRYPWDGKIDVQYCAQNTPNEGYQIAITVTLPNGTTASETHECKNGKNTLVFDARKAFGEVQFSKDVKVRATLVK